MFQHIRANLWLTFVTLLLCSVLYPLVLLGIGQTFFPAQAEGSLIRDAKGTVIGSRLIAQPFSGDEFFQPRPSAASFKADASAGSNMSANNPALRDRVARQLGPIVKYREGSGKSGPVGPDVEKWFTSQPDLAAKWAEQHPSFAQAWVKADPLNTAFVAEWVKAHPAEVVQWKKDNPTGGDPKPDDLAGPFFASFAKDHSGTWPAIVEKKTADGKTEKHVEPVKKGSDIQAYLFDTWRQANPTVQLENVPADMVMASGSGLDPHITLKSAKYQLDRVVAKWAEETKRDPKQVRADIESILSQQTEAPLGGLVGVPLVNVLETNLALQSKFRKTTTAVLTAR